MTGAIVDWYLRLYFRTPDDSGTAKTLCDPMRVGHFAIDAESYQQGEPKALFRLLVTTAMFQRRQDVQILRILRGISADDARELSDARLLLSRANRGACSHPRRLRSLLEVCDLTKDPTTRDGICTQNPSIACHLKRHTVLLKRYGHFGKVPTSVALMIREEGVANLVELRAKVLDSYQDPRERARALEAVLGRAWRVSQKIASMFLSAVSNPDLCDMRAPWVDGIDWTHFVVVDSNVDLFLESIRYRGGKSYDARRRFVQELAHRIDLHQLHPGLHAYNPRLVQQALYLFMSAANRRASTVDCSKSGPRECARCPRDLSSRCPVRRREE